MMSNPKETRLPEFLALNHREKAPILVDFLPASPIETEIGTTGNPEL